MSHWQAAASPSPLSVQQHHYNRSQEALVDDIGSAFELPPQSPVFDFEDFLTDPTTTTMNSTSHLSTSTTSTSVSDHHLDHPPSNLWNNWEAPSPSQAHQPINPFASNISGISQSFSNSIGTPAAQGSPALSPYRSSPSHPIRPYKPQDAMNISPQSTMTNAFLPQQQLQQQLSQYTLTQPSSYQPSSASFSDYELAISATAIPRENDVDMFHNNAATAPGKLDAHPLYHAFGRMPYGDSLHGNSQQDQYLGYTHDSINHSLLPAARIELQQRQFIPRRDSSVPPYATDYATSLSVARSNANAAVFAASAPNPPTFSNPGSFSPSSSPRSIDGYSVARSSPSIPPASPQLFTPSTPGEQFAAPPSHFSASPHQFTSLSPTFTSASPITFVNQTTHYTTSSATAHSDDPNSSGSQESTASEDSRLRKRRRVLLTDAEDDSDEKRSDDIPIKSELRPPKQAPSMWQVYFADWLQDHKARQPQDKLNVAQAAKEAGQLYKTLSAEAKEDLKRRVQQEKESRERRLTAWQRTLTPADIKRENKFRAAQRKAGLSRRANIKDPNAPKKPLSAYFMFLARIRSDPLLVEEVFGGETETTRQSVLAAQRWREMSDEEKKPFLTQAEHDKIQYEALRKIYEEQASMSERGSRSPARKQMTGTGYIVPQHSGTSEDLTAAIMSARPSMSEPDAIRMVAYDPEATISARKVNTRATPMPIFSSSTGTIRRRAARKTARLPGSGDGLARSYPHAADSGAESAESDDEWVPGKSI